MVLSEGSQEDSSAIVETCMSPMQQDQKQPILGVTQAGNMMLVVTLGKHQGGKTSYFNSSLPILLFVCYLFYSS